MCLSHRKQGSVAVSFTKGNFPHSRVRRAFPLPGSETQVLSECVDLLRDRLKATKPPKLKAGLFISNAKYLTGTGTRVLHNQSFLPQLPTYGGSQVTHWSECHFVRL